MTCNAMNPDYPLYLQFLESMNHKRSAVIDDSGFEIWQAARMSGGLAKDYAIYSAIITIETYCRYRNLGQAFQVLTEDRTTAEPVRVAWQVLKDLGVQFEIVGNHGNMRIVYDKSKNVFFGKA